MLVITNRNINHDEIDGNVGDENTFGEQVNAKGPNELRLAHATRAGGKWKVELVPEPPNVTPATAPSRVEYKRLVRACADAGKHCLFFVHGYNKSFPDYPRLGKTLRNLEADNARYLDFTLAKGVGNVHQLWGEVNTKTVKAVFGEAFSGRRAEEVSGIAFDTQANAYRVP